MVSSDRVLKQTCQHRLVSSSAVRLFPSRQAFEFVYCFGVLQHTPDVRRAFLALSEQVKPGGRIAVDLYPKLLLNVLWPKYWLRPLTRRMAPERLFGLVSRSVELLWPASLALGRVPGVGRRLRHALPIANYDRLLPLTPAQLQVMTSPRRRVNGVTLGKATIGFVAVMNATPLVRGGETATDRPAILVDHGPVGWRG